MQGWRVLRELPEKRLLKLKIKKAANCGLKMNREYDAYFSAVTDMFGER